MKNKKNIIIIVTCLILIGIIGFIMWNNRTVSTITLDINPSIKINLNKNDKVNRVIALNGDGKEVIKGSYRGRELDETLKSIFNNIYDEGYIERDNVDVLLYITGNINNAEVHHMINDSLEGKEVTINIVTIDSVTKEDEKLAKKYRISSSKAAFINSILKENENIPEDVLMNKAVRDLFEAKERGKYCPDGYFIEGDFCLRETNRINATPGMVCPGGYREYDGVCYMDNPGEDTGKLFCREEYTLEDEKCTRMVYMDAEPVKYKCESGEEHTRLEMGLTNADAGNANEIVCVDLSNATHPVSPCELPASDPTERMTYGGVCYWHRAPVIETGCPGKIQVAGECWDDASNILICAGYRDGRQYQSRSDYCEHSIRYIDPVVTEYKCPGDYTLNGSRCEKKEEEPPIHERTCPSGYSIVEYNVCIDYNQTTDKIDGYICDMPNTRVNGNTCIIYEMIDAKEN